jgi:cellulose synthase operon protein B
MFINMKKIIHLMLLVCVFGFYLDVNVVSALMPAIPQARQDGDVFTFTDLGVTSDIVLKGPYESRTVKFELPPTWVLQEGSEINLEVKSFFTTSIGEAVALPADTYTGVLLDVSFNKKLQQSIPLTTNGTTTYRIPVSPKDLSVPGEDGAYSITIALDAAIDCNLGTNKTTVVVGSNSFAILPHSEKTLELDLRKIPWPIYQEKAKSVGSAVVVLPSNPSASEVQAGLVVMGTFGRMTKGKLPLSLITFDQLTEAIQEQSDLILVGKPSTFQSFADILKPLTIANGQFDSSEVGVDDGVLQISISPWNAAKSILLVSGESDLGVVKTAQALSTGNLQTGITPNYSVVAQVNPVTAAAVVGQDAAQLASPDISFSDLGYTVITVDTLGSNYLTYEFSIPAGQIPSENPYLEIKFSNSTMVDPARSEINVFLNDVVVGSAQLSDGTTSLASAKIDLPASMLRFGQNRLDIVINLAPRDECSLLATSGLWATIYQDSFIHLPLVKTPVSSNIRQDIRAYPYPFANDSSLASTTFVVPEKAPAVWATAGKIAFDLGSRVNSSILGFSAAFDGQIPDASLAGNFIVVGEPKNLSVLTDMKKAMPAYFETGSNVAVLESQLVIYRVSEQKSLGYLELFTSPWNPQGVVLGVFGTNPDGLGFAVKSLLDFRLRETLIGNYAAYDGGSNAIVVDTRTGFGMGRFESSIGSANITSEAPTEAVQAGDSATVSPTNDKLFVLTTIAGVIFAMVVVVFLAFSLRKKKS